MPPPPSAKPKIVSGEYVIIHAASKTIASARQGCLSRGRVATGPIDAAISRAPGCPALFKRRRRRRLEYAGISQRDLGRQARLLIRRKTHRATTNAAGAAAEPAVNKRIEHDAQKLGHHLKAAAFSTGRHLAGQLRERIVGICAAKANSGANPSVRVPPLLKNLLIPVSHVLLIGIQSAASAEMRRRESERHAARRVAERPAKARTVEAAESAFHAAACLKDRVGLVLGIGAGHKDGFYGSGKSCRAADLDLRGRRAVERHDVKRTRLEGEIAGHCQRSHRAARS